jgi:hypothetical protein
MSFVLEEEEEDDIAIDKALVKSSGVVSVSCNVVVIPLSIVVVAQS